MNIRIARAAGALAVVGTVVGAGLAGADAHGSSARSAGQVLHLHGRITQVQIVDTDPSGASLGDEQVASGALSNPAGKRVGRFGFTCTYVRVTNSEITEQCAGWGQLPRGQLSVSGRSRYTDSTHVWAVTGGTGAFAGSRGSITITDRSNTRESVVVRLL